MTEEVKDKNGENGEQDTEEKKDIEAESDDDTSKKIDSEEESEEEGEGEVDYKSEYERLQGELAQKNEHIAKQDKKIIKLKQKSSEEEDEKNTEEEANVSDLVQKEVQKQMSNFVEDTIEEEIDKISSNEDEKKLIKWYFDNRISKAGWSKKEIADYVNDAKALANRGSLLAKSKAISKKAKSDETSGSPAFAGTPPSKKPRITEYDRKMADKFFKGDVEKWMKFKPN